MIRTGIEPVSSDNRSAILPLNYPIFTSVTQVTTHQIFVLNIKYVQDNSDPTELSRTIAVREL